jgi:hypothetical protein
VQLRPVLLGEVEVGEHVVLGLVHEGPSFGKRSRSRSATARHSARAASCASCVKAVQIAAATIARCFEPT